MNTLRQLQEKEHMLSGRVLQLKNALASAEENVTGENIPQKAEEIHSLETQLKLTEKALQSTQDKLRELEQVSSSKEFKDKLKQAENLRKQAQKETVTVFENLVEMQKTIEEVNKKLKVYDKLRRETGNKSILGTSCSQPFAWLFMLKQDIDKRVKDTVFLRNKLEV